MGGSDVSVIHRSTIGDILTRSARRHADRLAVVFRDRSYTYGELDVASDRVAAFLHGLGLVKGDRVAAYGRNSDAYLLLWLGAVKAGLVHVPINYALTGAELAYIVRQSGSRMLFADPALREAAQNAELPLDLLGSLQGGPADTDILAQAQNDREADWEADWEAEVGDDDVAQLLYTSGTTAAPKGAVLTHRALVHHYASAAMATDLREHERMLHALPLYHSAQMHVFLMPALMTGMSNWLLETPDPAQVLQMVTEHEIGSFFAPPTVWLALLERIEPDPIMAATLQKGYYGASIMPLPVLERLRKTLPQLGLYNCFGQSEIGPLAAVLRPEEHETRPASAGRAIPFVDLRVVDDDMQDVPVGEIGEVVYRSPQLCRGYWEMPEETAAAFAGGWFHSGDLARQDEAGYITIVDRKKDVIKTGGILVSSREVEEALFTHPQVQEVAVIPLPDAKWVEAVTAVVVLRPESTVDAAELQAYARTKLAPFKVPKTVVFVDALPKNGAGKILKRELRDRFAPV
jgi:fatty-acyl-CoA synthase